MYFIANCRIYPVFKIINDITNSHIRHWYAAVVDRHRASNLEQRCFTSFIGIATKRLVENDSLFENTLTNKRIKARRRPSQRPRKSIGQKSPFPICGIANVDADEDDDENDDEIYDGEDAVDTR